MLAVEDEREIMQRLNPANKKMARQILEALIVSQRNTEDTIRPKIEWLPEVKAQIDGSADYWHKWKDEVEED